MASTIQLAPIEAAKIQYAEHYGSVLTTNTALKATVFLLAGCVCAMTWKTLSVSKALYDQKPIVIRVNEVGRAERVDYHYSSYLPQPAELRYFVNQFIEGYYSRQRASVKDQYTASLAFLSESLYNQQIYADRKTNWLANFIQSSDEENTVFLRQAVFDDQGHTIHATVDFDKIYHDVGGAETRRETYTTVLYFLINPERAAKDNGLAKINPLGFSIVSQTIPHQSFVQ